MKGINLIWIIPITLILGIVLGFGWGLDLAIPEDINIDIDSEGRLESFSIELEICLMNLPKLWVTQLAITM